MVVVAVVVAVVVQRDRGRRRGGRRGRAARHVYSFSRMSTQVERLLQLEYRGHCVALHESCCRGSGVYIVPGGHVVKAECADSPRSVRRLLDELKIAEQMGGCGIGPRVYRRGILCLRDGLVVTFLEMARHATLSHTTASALVVDSISRTVHALAAMGYMHVDLKPENVVVDRATGIAKLIDFSPVYVQPVARRADAADVALRHAAMMALFAILCRACTAFEAYARYAQALLSSLPSWTYDFARLDRFMRKNELVLRAMEQYARVVDARASQHVSRHVSRHMSRHVSRHVSRPVVGIDWLQCLPEPLPRRAGLSPAAGADCPIGYTS